MREVSTTATIPADPMSVFDFIADPTNLPAWQTGIVSARVTSSGPLGPGSTAAVTRELMGQRLSVVLTLTDMQRGRRLVLESAASGIGVEAMLDLEPADGGTRLTFGMRIRAQNMFMAPVEGMVASAAEHDLADSLERLRSHFSAPAA